MYIFYNKTRVGMYNGFVLAYARERGTDFSIGRDDRNFHKSTYSIVIPEKCAAAAPATVAATEAAIKYRSR